ncbi:MAG: hypothetical protein WDO14_18315 [Bacteroidota bacterium]
MKFYLKPVLSVLALATLLVYSGCGGGGDPGPTEEEKALTSLSATWKVAGGANNDVTLDGVSKKADYNGFTLTISGTAGAASYGYTTAGRPSLSAWPANGSWKFGDPLATDITRDPGTDKEVDIHYTVTGDQLELTFTYNQAGESRTDKVTGVWIFRMSK